MKELGVGNASIDAVRDYWNSRPCNVKHSSKQIGTKEYFDEVEAKRYLVEPHIPIFAEFDKYTGKRVLEIGCGIGTDAVNFARSGCIYTGTDLSESSLDLAKERFNVYGLTGNFQCVDAENLSEEIKTREFDLIYSFGVIHHSPNPTKIVEEIAKLLPKGGELKLMVYAKNSWKATMIDAGFDQPEAQFGCPIALSFDDQDITEILQENFHITSISQDHIFPYVIEDYKKNIYKLEPWFEKMPKLMFRALAEKFGWHKMIRAIRR